MKAAVVCANEDVRYMDYEEPQVTPGTVKVKVKASGICGSDIPRVLHNGVHFYPIVLGHEFSGDVVEVGEGVTSIKVGDHVSGAPLVPCMKCDDCQKGNFSLCKHYSFIGSRQQGSNADYVVIPEQNAVVYDPSISYEQAAMFEPSTVALHGVYQNQYQGGGYVAVLGGGTIGMFTMQWTKIFGSKKVVVFDISEERLELAKRLAGEKIYTVISGAPSEAEMGKEIRAISPSNYTVDLIGRTNLLELAALDEMAALHISCDTGPLHIANAAQTPLIALFGPTLPGRSGPYGNPNADVLLAENPGRMETDMATISVDQVFELAMKKMRQKKRA